MFVREDEEVCLDVAWGEAGGGAGVCVCAAEEADGVGGVGHGGAPGGGDVVGRFCMCCGGERLALRVGRVLVALHWLRYRWLAEMQQGGTTLPGGV